MADFFKSAFGGVFSNQASNLPGGGGADPSNNAFSGHNNQNSQSNDFVGQNIILGNHKLRIARLIAEGGFAIVYLAVDVNSGEEFALKRIFSADDVSNRQIREEIGYLVSRIKPEASQGPFKKETSYTSLLFKNLGEKIESLFLRQI